MRLLHRNRQRRCQRASERLLFIDNLCFLLICGVLVVHLDVTYGGLGSWYYHDPSTNLLTGILLSILTVTGQACGTGFYGRDFYRVVI